MDPLTGAVAFFDIGGTLASATLSPRGDRIEGLAVYPFVPEVLGRLRERGTRLGIISDPGPFPGEDLDRALEAADLRRLLEPELVLYGRKDSPAVFGLAMERAGGADRILFVGEDPGERAQALRAGLLVAPHPRLAVAVLEEQGPLRYVRITVPPAHAAEDWRAELGKLPLLLLHAAGPAGTTVYAIATTSAAARLDDLGFRVDRLGVEDEPLTTDLYLLRDDRQIDTGFLAGAGNSRTFFDAGPAARTVLTSTEEGLVVAVPAGRSVEDYHFSAARHGHNLKLVPSALAAMERVDDRAATAEARAVRPTITPEEKELLDAAIQPRTLADHVARYSGAAPGTVSSPAGTSTTGTTPSPSPRSPPTWSGSARGASSSDGTASRTRDGRCRTSRPSCPGPGSTGWCS